MNHHISKLFFWITSIIVILGFYISCSSTKDISKEPPYNQCIGKKFILKEDVYLFQDHGSSQYSIAPQHSGIMGLPPLVDEKYFNDPYYTNKKNRYLFINGIIQRGSIFTIMTVIEVSTFETSYTSFSIKFNNLNFSKNGINATCILNLNNPPYSKTWSDPPIFDANLVEPLPSDGIWWK